MHKVFFYLILVFLGASCSQSKKAGAQADIPNEIIDSNMPPIWLEGFWKMKVVTPVGIHYPEMILEQEDNVASGDLSGNPVVINIYGDSVSFSSSRKTPLGTFNFDYTGKQVMEDSLQGIFKMRGGPFANKDYDWGARRLRVDGR